MRTKWERTTAIVIAVLIIASFLSVRVMREKYNIVTDIAKVKLKAENLYAAGEKKEAISALGAYCAEAVTDIDAAATLGDWYMELGDEDAALAWYYKAAMNKKSENAEIAPVTVKTKGAIVSAPVAKWRMEITPDVRVTKGMTLTVTNSNLVTGEPIEGKIEKKNEDLTENQNYMTTQWFEVTDKGGYLTMYGDFNCAVWQFKDGDENIIYYAESKNVYNNEKSVGVNNYQMARVKIPEEARMCRVTYYDKRKSASDALGDMIISYGRLPKRAVSGKVEKYEIPDLREGEKVIFEDGKWFFVGGDERSEPLDMEAPAIERGSVIKIEGVLPGRVDFTGSVMAKKSREGIYTVRFNRADRSGLGERLDDSKGLDFNAAAGGSFLNLGNNDFDDIYPWSEIKLCAIKNGKIVYEGESGFSTDGSAGDVFVEIPKFYCKRSVSDGFETISISGTLHGGFSLDEAFKSEDGEADKTYVAAYMSSISEDGKAVSVSGKDVKLLNSAHDIEAALKEGFSEIDVAAVGMIQKLFEVETAMRNSQLLYLGVCALSSPEEDFYESRETRQNTNTILVDSEASFANGEKIIIFEKGSGASIEKALSDPRSVETVINNGDNTKTIYFSGEPINVNKERTAAAHISFVTGTTNAYSYHTAAGDTARGTLGFKYRHMENIWGNAFVLVGGVKIDGDRVEITKRNGEKKVLSYRLPDGGMIKNLGFDKEASWVMLPEETGAAASDYTGDAFTEGGDSLLWGGSWNEEERAGIFCCTAANMNEKKLSAAGRMMYIKR